MEWDNSSWAYDRIEESLHRWKGVSVHYWNAWRDHANGTWTDTEAVGIIDYFKITDGRRTQKADDRNAQSRFVWNRQLFKSFQDGYMKPLDFGLYRSLKRPAAKRALRFLSKRFYHKPEWEFDFHNFACDKLGFSRSYDTGQLKAAVGPALKELIERGVLNSVKYRRVRPKCWKILLTEQRQKEELQPSMKAGCPQQPLQMLTSRGVAQATAEAILAEFPREQIEEKVRFVDWLVGRGDKRVSLNGAGFLVAAIRKNYSLPRDYVKLGRKLPRVKAVPPSHPVAVSESPEDQAVRAYLARLGSDELRELEVAALAAADSYLAEGYQRSKVSGGPAFAVYRQMVIEKHVRDLLAAQPNRESEA